MLHQHSLIRISAAVQGCTNTSSTRNSAAQQADSCTALLLPHLKGLLQGKGGGSRASGCVMHTLA